MTDRDFDKIFRDKLADLQTAVDADVWSAIESDLNRQKAVPVGFWSKSHNLWRIAGYAASVVALFILVFVLSKEEIQIEPESGPYIHQGETGPIAILDENPSEPEDNQPIEKTFEGLKAFVASEKGRSLAQNMTDAGKSEKTEETSESVATKASDDVTVGDAQYESGEYMADLGLSGMGKGRGKEYSFSLFSNVASNNNVAVTSQYLTPMAASGISHSNAELQSMDIISDAKYSLPINVGVQLQVKVSDVVSVGAGLSYTCLKSRYDGLINKKFHRIKQSLHYIGIPVNLYFNIMESNKFRLYVNVGGAIEKGVRASYRVKSYDGTAFSAKAKIEGLQYSANAGLGLEYRFSEPVGLYLEPNAVYFFDSEIPASIRTSQPMQIKAEIGFRFHLNR